MRRKPDITLAKELLDWEPKVAMKEGLARTMSISEHYRDESRKVRKVHSNDS